MFVYGTKTDSCAYRCASIIPMKHLHISPMRQNGEPVFLFTEHSMGKAWQMAIISPTIVA